MHLWAYQVKQWTERSLPCRWAGVVDAGCLTLCQTFLKAKGRRMPRSRPLAVSSDTTERSPLNWILNICSPSRRWGYIDLGNDWRERIKKALSEGRQSERWREKWGRLEGVVFLIPFCLASKTVDFMYEVSFLSHNFTSLRVCASGLKGPAGPTESNLLCVLYFSFVCRNINLSFLIILRSSIIIQSNQSHWFGTIIQIDSAFKEDAHVVT